MHSVRWWRSKSARVFHGTRAKPKMTPCGGEIFLQLLNDSCGTVVDVGDGFGIDDEPAHGGG